MVSSIHCQGWTSYMPCQPTFAFYGGTSACDQLPFHVSSWTKFPSILQIRSLIMEKVMHKFTKGLYLFAVKKMNFKQEN